MMTDRVRKGIIFGTLALNALATFSLWWRGSSPFFDGNAGDALIALGRLAGLIAELAILTELVMISRLPFVERVFGFDGLNKAHRTVGYWLAGGIVSHPIMIVAGYAIAGKVAWTAQLWDFFTNWEDVLGAAVGLAVILGAALVSIPVIRRKLKYEVWHLSHLAMYLGVGLALNHQFNTSEDMARPWGYYWYALNYLVFGVVLVWRFGRPFALFARHRFRVEAVVEETHNVRSVVIGGVHMDRFAFEAGQFVNILFLAKGFLQPHPFSFSAAPDGKRLRLSIKASGDFTSRIKDLKPGTPVVIDGPLGRFTERAAVKGKYLFVAGGIGITPIRSMIEGLCRKGSDLVLLYGNRSEKDYAFRKELEAMSCRMHPVFSADSPAGHETGTIDLERVRRLAPDFLDRDIYVCGPTAMMDALIAQLKGAGVTRAQLHYEKFAF